MDDNTSILFESVDNLLFLLKDSAKLRDAIVFCDHQFQQVFTWNGINFIEQGAAVQVINLEQFESVNNNNNNTINVERLRHAFALHAYAAYTRKPREQKKATKQQDNEFESWGDNDNFDDEDEQVEEEDDDEEDAQFYKTEEEIEQFLSQCDSLPHKAVFFVSNLSNATERSIRNALYAYQCFTAISVFVAHSTEYCNHVQEFVDTKSLSFEDLQERTHLWALEALQRRINEQAHEKEVYVHMADFVPEVTYPISIFKATRKSNILS